MYKNVFRNYISSSIKILKTNSSCQQKRTSLVRDKKQKQFNEDHGNNVKTQQRNCIDCNSTTFPFFADIFNFFFLEIFSFIASSTLLPSLIQLQLCE